MDITIKNNKNGLNFFEGVSKNYQKISKNFKIFFIFLFQEQRRALQLVVSKH